MSNYALFELQKSLYQKLSGDSTLMTLVTGIYDYVPSETNYPYITLGEATVRDWSSTTTTGMACSVVLRVFSRQAGRKQVANIMERVHALLHRQGLSVSGMSTVLVRFESSETQLGNDGATYQGVMRFRILLQN